VVPYRQSTLRPVRTTVVRAPADQRGLNAGIDRERAGQAVDETDVESELLTATPLFARVEEQFDEAQQ